MAQRTKNVKKRAGKVIHSAVTKHAIAKAEDIRSRMGSDIDYATLLSMFDDRRSFRYPVKLQFVTDDIEPGMFGKTEAVSDNPDDGYVIYLHRHFENQAEALPLLILYQSVLVNYGDLATADDAELFGSTLLNMDRDEYYQQIETLTDSLWGQ